MGKWRRIEPAYIKAGDRVRFTDKRDDYTISGRGVVTRNEGGEVTIGVARWLHKTPGYRRWFVRKPKHPKLKASVWKEPMSEADEYDGHAAHYWRNRYTKQLAHSEQLQVANKNRRQKMQLLKKEAKDARGDSDYWRGEYAKVAAALHELRALTDPPEPLTRPDEPPVGTFFRVERTGQCYQRGRYAGWPYCNAPSDGHCYAWERITEPGDTITRLELTEVGDKRDADA